MGTEVMKPQDCLIDRFRVHPVSFHRRRNIPNRKTSPKQDGKKRSNYKAEISKKLRDGDVSDSRQRDENTLVVGQITLLRRGESLDSLAARIKDGNQQIHKSENQIPVDDVTSVRFGDVIVPDSPPEMVPKKIRLEAIDTYAGSSTFLSPSPRALPLPSFFKNNKKQGNNDGTVPHDSATRDLMRMLRLE